MVIQNGVGILTNGMIIVDQSTHSQSPPLPQSQLQQQQQQQQQKESLSNSDVEDAKNMALLFFMDHLMQKSGERTIHDLSCQFGARGFSPEMREAVGNTQEGLQEFLAMYPSLFKVDGDSVSINAFGDLAMGTGKSSPLMQTLSCRDRDYIRESIEFFEGKLRKFGPELLIKSLLGHRSQAAPEVRVVSGRHVKEFTDFLSQHPDHFIVEGDRVRLSQMPEPSQKEGDLDESGVPLAGARAKQAAVDFMREVLENQELPMPMESLYSQFCDRFSHVVRQEVATNPKELLSFLKLNRNIFFIRSNKVSLVKNREGIDGEGGLSGAPSPGLLDTGTESDSGSCSGSGNNILDMITVVKGLRSAQEAVAEIMASGQSVSHVVAVDFKMVSLGQGSPEYLALVIVRSPSGRLFIFDVAHSDSILLESGVKDIFESAEWLKVMHDCKSVSFILGQQYGITLQCIFDTQVGNTLLQHQRTGKPLEELRGISFHHLQRLYAPESIMQSDINPRKLQKNDMNFWSVRPLTEEMVKIAVEEVRVLYPTIYQMMCNALNPDLQPLFNQMCALQLSAPTHSSAHNGSASLNGTSTNNNNNTSLRPSMSNGHFPPAPASSSSTAASNGGGSVVFGNHSNSSAGIVFQQTPVASASFPTLQSANNQQSSTKFMMGGAAIRSSESNKWMGENGGKCCNCNCGSSDGTQTNKSSKSTSTTSVSTQTLSTGDITMSQIYREQ